MSKKRPEELQTGVQIWGSAQDLESRIKELTEEVRALRAEIKGKPADRHRLGTANDNRLPKRSDASDASPQARSRKRR